MIFSGLDKPTTAVRIHQDGPKWVADPIWSNDQVPMYMSSPVAVGSTLFGLTHRNRGQLFALDLKTGKTLWTTQGREGDNASLIGSPTWLMIATTNSELLIARPDAAGFKEVQRYTIADSPVWAHPAVEGRLLLIKDAEKVICWRF